MQWAPRACGMIPYLIGDTYCLRANDVMQTSVVVDICRLMCIVLQIISPDIGNSGKYVLAGYVISLRCDMFL